MRSGGNVNSSNMDADEHGSDGDEGKTAQTSRCKGSTTIPIFLKSKLVRELLQSMLTTVTAENKPLMTPLEGTVPFAWYLALFVASLSAENVLP